MKNHIFNFIKIFMIVLIIVINAYSLFRWYNRYDMKYFLSPSFQNVFEYILIVVCTVTLCVIVFLFQKKLRKKSVKICCNVACSLLVLSSFFAEGFILSTWVHKSQTNDINNYLQIDCQELRKEKYFSFLPVAINEQAQNLVYDYQWRVANFAGSGAYVYFSCILPETEYDQEKRRIEDISAENNILLSTIGKSQVYYYPYDYSVPNEHYNVFEVTFNDAQHMVSYFCAINCFWNCDWQTLNYTNQEMLTNQWKQSGDGSMIDHDKH